MYDKILVPTDGSEGSEVAVQHAREIAVKFNSELHVVYVVDERISSTNEVLASMTDEFRDIGRKATENLKKQLKEVPTVTDIVQGVPHKMINSYAKEEDIDLIVMGTHGRTGLDRVLLGSTTEKVIRTSDIPVMTVKRPE